MIGIESNDDELIARLRTRMLQTLDLTEPLEAAGNAVRDAAVERFTNNEWAPNSPFTIAQKGSSRPGIDTGALRNSISSRVDGDAAIIGTNVVYAKWLQFGTGVFAGHSEWTIRPKSGGALKFRGPGGDFFRREVTMRGQPPRPFLLIGDAERASVAAIFRAWIARQSETGNA